ncbi:aspartate decarboxylase-like domain-containing protein [Trichoderma sp. SZMC 28012]
MSVTVVNTAPSLPRHRPVNIVDVSSPFLRLISLTSVTDAVNDDNSIIALSEATIDALQCFRGDTVLVRGKKRKETMLIVLADEELNEGSAKIYRVVRYKLRVKYGDIITISPCPHIKYAKRTAVFPIADTVEGLTGSLFDVFLALYFREAYRPENFVISRALGD